MSILELFCLIDDFWLQFGPQWERTLLASGAKHRRRPGDLHPSEIVTLLIYFHQSHFRTFKWYYTHYVQVFLRREFPHLVSYPRFVELMSTYLVPLAAFLQTQLAECTGISFIDSTALAVCKNPRIRSHRVFAGLARRGKTTVGWFYGFKLHLVINERGELLSFCLTPGNVDDRRPIRQLVQRLFGKVFGDRGYISHNLTEQLLASQGLQLITKLRKNMPPRQQEALDQLLLRKRAIIETVNDQLKNISQIEHTRHRSPLNFLVNLVGGLIAYCLQPKKPSLSLEASLALVV